MRRTPAALLVIGSLAVTACSGRDTTSPRGIAPDGANYATTPGYPSCDFTAINAAKKSAFSSNKDSAYTYVAALQKAFNGGLDKNATNIVWQIGRLVAKERLTTATTSASAVATFLVDVLQCASDVRGTAPYPQLALPDTFVVHAASIISSGIWEVRGGTVNSQAPAAGRVIDNSSHVRNFGLPRWGGEPVNATWPGATEYAYFGYPINIGTLIVGAPNNINTNEVPANGFELGTIPANTPKTDIRVGVCVNVDAGTGVANRIVHNNSTILDASTLTQLCTDNPPSYVAMLSAPSGWFASTLSRIGGFLTPRNAFAQILGIGSLPSDYSPFSANAITAATIQLSYLNPPSDTTVSQTDTVVVSAAIGATPVPGVVVTISIAGNSGQAGGALFDNGQTSEQATTAADGTVTFIYKIGKAGGYTITSSGTIDGFPVGNTLSGTLNIQNK